MPQTLREVAGLGTTPGTGDVGVWDSTVTTAGGVALGGNLTWGGIRLGSGVNAPGGSVTITGSNTIDLSSTLSALDVGDTRSITFSNIATNATRFATLRGSTMVTISNANTITNSAFGSGALNFTGALLLRGGSATIADGVISNVFFFDASANDFQVAATKFALDTGASTTDRKDFGLGGGFATSGRSLVVSSLQGYGAIRVDGGTTAGARTLIVDQASTTTFDGAVLSHRSSTGGVQRSVTLEKQGAGSLTLAGFVGKQTTGASAGAVAVNLVANGGLLSVTNALNTTAATPDARYSGTVTVTSGTLAFSSQAILNNAGTTTVSAGTLALSGSGSIGTGGLNLGTTASPGAFDLAALVSGTYSLPATGDLAGVGTLSGAGKSLAVLGSFLPGNSPGTVSLGTGFTLDLSQSGASVFKITSPLYAPGTFDLVNGAGSVVCGGILSLQFSGGTYANGSDVLTLFGNSGGLSGDFTSVVATGLGDGQYATFNPATGSISVVPEPATCVMALAGLACGGFSVWRRRRAYFASSP